MLFMKILQHRYILESSLINIQKTCILHIRIIIYYTISLRVLKIKIISIIIKLTVNLICDIDLWYSSFSLESDFKSDNHTGTQFIELKNIFKNLHKNIIKHQDTLRSNKGTFLF